MLRKYVSNNFNLIWAWPSWFLFWKDPTQKKNSSHSKKNNDFFSAEVLDEADRLLSLGFLPEVKEIVSYLPSRSTNGSWIGIEWKN